jgi:methyltransferase-like protein
VTCSTGKKAGHLNNFNQKPTTNNTFLTIKNKKMKKFWNWFGKYGFLVIGISNLLTFNPYNAIIGIVFIIFFIVDYLNKKNNQKDLVD